ncbi:MAG: prepilin-type N-terminal cleavage/methylation domain-containing protein [Oligoflexia bacterium]|nr:prepilin-type N-terminal cleavage/methylation domain-containing protein [Oligoflexia bacterium]
MYLRSNQSGFTLIEIMIALVLMSFISIGVFTITTNNLETKDMVTNEDRAFFQSYGAFDRISRDIEQLWSPYYYDAPKAKKANSNSRDSYDEVPSNDFIVRESFKSASSKNHPVPDFSIEDKSVLQFITSSHLRRIEGQKESQFAWIQYSLENYEGEKEAFKGTQNLVRKVISQDIYKADLEWAKIKGQVLLKGVKDIKYDFWSQKQEKWLDDIRQFDVIRKSAPQAIRLYIKWIDSNEIEQSTLKVFRPHWPYFDVVEDFKIKEAARKPKNGNSGNRGSNNNGSSNNSGGNSGGSNGGQGNVN